ncbi:MAG TPA: GvpL/GvpF family gas vesicle protein [Micromonosporaceae bacterium]
MSATADAAVAGASLAGQESGAWLHGVIGERDRLPEITGIEGQPVREIRAGGLTAVVSPVSLTQYGEDALRRNLEDLGWLERTARAHHLVVDALSRTGPVVPARLATVYSDEGRVAAVLAERSMELRAALDRVTDRAEWGVKGYLVPAGAPQAEPAGPGGAGTAYLRKRRAQLMARDEGQQAAARDAAVVHAALSERAVASRRHAPQDRRLSGADTAMVLNGAYLVDSARADEFADLVEVLAGRYPAVRLQITGPWPPYSFAADEPRSEPDQ